MKLRVTFNNLGGALATEVAKDETEAAIVAVRMIHDAGELHSGDTIVIEEVAD